MKKIFSEWDKFKKVIYIIMVVLIFIRIFYIVVGKDLDMEYNTSSPASTTYTEMPCNGIDTEFSTQEKRINSFEFIFNNINEDKKGAVICKVTHNNDVIYQANISLKNINNNEWWKVYVNIPVKPGDEYHIILGANKDCTDTPNVLLVSKDKGCTENISTRSKSGDAGGTLAIHYGYLDAPGKADLIVNSSLWIILLIMITYIFMYSGILVEIAGKAIAKSSKYLDKTISYIFFELALYFAFVYTSGIQFDKPMEILLFVISVISAVVYVKKRGFFSDFFSMTWKRNALILICLVGSFCIVGQRIFIYPLSIKPTLSGILVYLLTTLWVLPVIVTFLYFFNYFCTKLIENKRVPDKKMAIIVLILLIIPTCYNLFANNPAISNGDSLGIICNAHALYGIADWHPAFYCMVIGAIIRIWDSTYAIILFQYLFWIYVIAELLIFLRKKGMNDSAIIAASALLGLNAANIMHINLVEKDCLYTLSVLWTFVILAKLTIDYDLYRKKWYIYLELIIALVGTCLYRKNGIVTFIIVVASTVIVLRKNYKAVISLMIAIMLVITIKGPVYSHFGVLKNGRNGMYIGLSQDILGTYYAGGNVSEKTLKMINDMTCGDSAEYEYNPTFATLYSALDVAPKEFICSYVDTFIRNPILMTRAVIDREDLVWDIFTGEDSVIEGVNFNGTQDGVGTWNDFYPERVFRSLYNPMLQATTYSATNQIIFVIEWRAGLLSILSLITVLFLFMKKGWNKYLLICMPVVGHFISLLLSTGWSDFRYVWPLNLMNFSIILLSMVILNDSIGVKKKCGKFGLIGIIIC